MRAPFQAKTPQFSIGFLFSVLLGHFLPEETFKVGFLVTGHEEKSLFQNRSVPRFFVFCFFICFRNKLGTHTKGTSFAQQEQRSANFGTIWSVSSKLEHKVPFHASQ